MSKNLMVIVCVLNAIQYNALPNCPMLYPRVCRRDPYWPPPSLQPMYHLLVLRHPITASARTYWGRPRAGTKEKNIIYFVAKWIQVLSSGYDFFRFRIKKFAASAELRFATLIVFFFHNKNYQTVFWLM